MPVPFLIAVDVGNARLKLGSFVKPCGGGLPEPGRTLHLAGPAPQFALLADWLHELEAESSRPVPVAEATSPAAHPGPVAEATSPAAHPGPVAEATSSAGTPCASHPTAATPLPWYIGSVNRPAAGRLLDWLRDHRPHDAVTLLAAGDLPLGVRLDRPDMVGVDRLLDAIAANRLRPPGVPAVVVDVGSAITVDLVSAAGEFCGGAILPGIAMSAQALHRFTDLLPLIDATELVEPPPALGTDTDAAMRAGLFWGAVGSIRQLVTQLAAGQDAAVFLTGGAGPAVAALLGPRARHIPHLTLAGIALAAEHVAG